MKEQIIANIDQALDANQKGQLVDFANYNKKSTLLIAQLASGPAPRVSLLNFRRLVDAHESLIPKIEKLTEFALANLFKLLSSGSDLPRILVADPRRLRHLNAVDLNGLTIEERWKDYPKCDEIADRLIAFRNDQFIRLAIAEFNQAPLEEVTFELTQLADICLEQALNAALAQEESRYGIPCDLENKRVEMTAIAMGKYGAEELNFCSDIDLIFIYETDEGADGAGRSLHEHFSGVCQNVVKILSAPRQEGFVFRVDLRLRPEGSRGPICNSLIGAQNYYETWARPYDRLSWLKARPAAGNLLLGQELCDFLRPFVFPRSLSFDMIDELHGLSRMIRADLAKQYGQTSVQGWNVKLSSGGIRDIEFFVQAHQLIHAGRQPALQERSTLRALDKLLFHGLVSEDEREILADAYELYRRLEHRLQLHSGRQTHLLPDRGELRDQIIQHLGFSIDDFEKRLLDSRRNVEKIYKTLGVSSHENLPLSELFDSEFEKDEAKVLLANAGFKELEWSYSQIRILQERPHGPFGKAAKGDFAQLGRFILADITQSPEPEAALRHMVDLSLRLGPRSDIWRMFAANPALRTLVVSLFGTSDFLARLLIRHVDLFKELLTNRRFEQLSDQSMDDLFHQALKDTDKDDEESIYGAIERFRDQQVLRIGLMDISSDLDASDVWRELSVLAKTVLNAVYQLVYHQAIKRYGEPKDDAGHPVKMSIMGLGKLGGSEMSYGSDLDLIFVYSAEGYTTGNVSITNSEFFIRLAQRLINALTTGFVHGALYSVDTRLRPSGAQGTLVVSIDAFKEYHRSKGRLWEKQVLSKADIVGGDFDLGKELCSWIDGYLYDGKVDSDEFSAEICHLRARIENELAQENQNFYNLKLGKGGLLDIEFIVQYLQLIYGHQYASLKKRSTLDVLDALASENLITNEIYIELKDAYYFLRRLESRLRIVRGSSEEKVPIMKEALDVVAKRLGLRMQADEDASDQLLMMYRSYTEKIRSFFIELIGPLRSS